MTMTGVALPVGTALAVMVTAMAIVSAPRPPGGTIMTTGGEPTVRPRAAGRPWMIMPPRAAAMMTPTGPHGNILRIRT